MVYNYVFVYFLKNFMDIYIKRNIFLFIFKFEIVKNVLVCGLMGIIDNFVKLFY